jgi:hypothetical protein
MTRYIVILLVLTGLGYYACSRGYAGDCCRCVSKKVSQAKFLEREYREREIEGYPSLGKAIGAILEQTRVYTLCRTDFRIPYDALQRCRNQPPGTLCSRKGR